MRPQKTHTTSARARATYAISRATYERDCANLKNSGRKVL